MAEEKYIKKIREILGLAPGDLELAAVPVATAPAAPDLPAVENILPHKPTETLEQAKPKSESEVIIREFGFPASRFFSKDWVRYPLVFLAAFGFFYLILNFSAISKQVASFFDNPARHDQASIEQVSPEYSQWLKKYYVYANDPNVFLANNDPDGDGLTNLQEFNLGTNPLKADTDGDGYPDGREVLNGYNPLYAGKLTADEQEVISKEIDKQAVESRSRLENVSRVAGGSTDLLMDNYELDPSKPGNLKIPKLDVDVAIVWTKDFKDMENDLKYGVAHHPGTPYPGEKGTASIHGHSSGYPWDGNYKTVFTKLNYLEPGDEVLVTVFSSKGESRQYRFLVRSKQIFAKGDPGQFADLGGYYLNLSTSWPVGTAKQRYVVTTELVGI
jgi:LPXTG-site transpeptidase (sortase) family protein